MTSHVSQLDLVPCGVRWNLNESDQAYELGIGYAYGLEIFWEDCVVSLEVETFVLEEEETFFEQDCHEFF
jgi:hypothetical protein